MELATQTATAKEDRPLWRREDVAEQEKDK